MKTLWCKNQGNPSDRISHTWAPLKSLISFLAHVFKTPFSPSFPTPVISCTVFICHPHAFNSFLFWNKKSPVSDANVRIKRDSLEKWVWYLCLCETFTVMRIRVCFVSRLLEYMYDIVQQDDVNRNWWKVPLINLLLLIMPHYWIKILW